MQGVRGYSLFMARSADEQAAHDATIRAEIAGLRACEARYDAYRRAGNLVAALAEKELMDIYRSTLRELAPGYA